MDPDAADTRDGSSSDEAGPAGTGPGWTVVAGVVASTLLAPGAAYALPRIVATPGPAVLAALVGLLSGGALLLGLTGLAAAAAGGD